MIEKVLLFTLALAAVLVGLGLWWRRAARYRSLPCPSWLGWLLDNPYTEAVARTYLTLDRANVGPGMSVLDIGCGTGRLAIPAAKRVRPDGQVVALDIQPAMLREVERRASASGLTNIRTVSGGIGRGLLEHNAFERALLVTVLGEIPEREHKAALREIFEALKPGGILSVTEIFLDPHYQTRATVRRLTEAAGLCLESQYGSWLSYTMNFVKPHPADNRGSALAGNAEERL